MIEDEAVGRSRRTLVALCLCAGLAGMSIGVIRPTLVAIADTYAISVALAGQLMTAAALAGLVGNLLLAPLVDRINRRMALATALGMMAVASLGCALAPTFVGLALAYALAGLSGITCLALVIASAGDAYAGAQRGKALGWIMAGNVGLGIVVLPVLSALADIGGWPVVFYGFAASAGIAAAFALWALPHQMAGNRGERQGYLGTLGGILRNRAAVAVLLTIGAFHASIYGFSTYAGAIAIERFSATTAQAGLAVTARLLGMAVVGILVGRFSRASDWRMAAGASVMGALLGVLGYAAAPSLWAYSVLMMLHGAAIAIADIAAVGLLLEAAPSRRGSATALRSVMEGVGGMAGPAAGGAVIAAVGYIPAALVFALLALVSALTMMLAAATGILAGPEDAMVEQGAGAGPVASYEES